MTAGTLTGDGVISADGGKSSGDGGGGGGGRIAIYCDDMSGFTIANITVDAGTGYQNGESGTIYIGALPPSLISPAQDDIITNKDLTFEWSAVSDAESYEILVDNNSGFGSAEINEIGLTETTITKINHLPDNVYYWKVRAKLSGGSYTAWSAPVQFIYQLPGHTDPVWVPLYRLYNNDIHDHYYTTIPAHRDECVQNKGYTYEKIECYISDRKFEDPDCGYLFHLWDKTNDIHSYTSSESEKDDMIIDGFAYEGIVGFIYLEPFQGSVSFYRLYHDGNTDNFYTVSAFERDNAKNQWGFVEAGTKTNSEGHTIVGYASPDGLINPSSRLKFNARVGNGVNTGNGNLKLYEHTDFNIPGINISLVFARTYNSLNRGVDGPLGYGWTHSLDAVLKDDGKNVSVTWPDGHVDYYERGGSNMTPDNPAQASNPGCYDTIYQEWDGSYWITKKDQTQYVFKRPEGAEMNAPAQFRTIIEKNGNSISLWYEHGNLVWIQDTSVRTLNFTYYAAAEGHAGHIKEITDPIGRTITFEYDENDNLTGFTDARGNNTTYEYDGNHQLTKVIYPEGNEFTNIYENLKLVSQMMGSAANPIELEYQSGLTIVTDPYGKQSAFNITDDQLASIKDPLGNTAYFTFGDTANPTKPTQVKDKAGNITTCTYKGGADDAGKKVLQRGNLLSVKNALNEETLFQYDDKNNLIKKTDPLNHVTNYQYDPNQRNLIKITYPEGGIQDITYTANGQIETVTNPNGHITYYTYNTYGDVTRITDHLGNHIDFTYDGVGRALTKTDQLGRVTAYSYDGNDNLVSVIDADTKTTSYTYDKNNNLTTITDARGRETVRTYNDRNLLATETDAAGKTYQYGYDDKGNLVSVTDHDNNQTIYTYDDNNRVTAISYNGTTMVSFTKYDANGNLEEVSNSNDETSFVYDVLNRITSCNGSFGKTVSYEYGAAGNRTKIVYPGAGKDVDYEYDADNRVVKVTDWLNGETTYTYDSAGILQSSANPNGTTTTYTYDNADRLTGLFNRKSDNSVIADYSFTLDAFGNHKQVIRDEPLAPAFSAANIPYAYDDANKLTSAGSLTYTHDNRGNLIGSSTGDVYNFDYADRLTDVTIGGSTILYLYDGLGNRTARTEGDVQTRYVLDLNGPISQALEETDSAGNVTSYFVYGHGLISKITPDGQRYCYHYDSRGSTVSITDGDENITEKYAYDEFGKILASEETNPNPFRYVGRYGVMDEGNGLLFMRDRYYDVGTGRFLSKDPLRGELVEPGSLNRYVYVMGNPVMGIDPAGLEAELP